jgi:hypothetical protein
MRPRDAKLRIYNALETHDVAGFHAFVTANFVVPARSSVRLLAINQGRGARGSKYGYKEDHNGG